MGAGETYLRWTFYPWWQNLSVAEQDEYLAENDAPEDWIEQVRLQREHATRAGTDKPGKK
jgi:hypothetical protein